MQAFITTWLAADTAFLLAWQSLGHQPWTN